MSYWFFFLPDALGGWRMVMAWSCISIVHRHFWHSGNPGRLLHYFFHFRVSISFFLLAFFNYYYLEHFLLHTVSCISCYRQSKLLTHFSLAYMSMVIWFYSLSYQNNCSACWEMKPFSVTWPMWISRYPKINFMFSFEIIKMKIKVKSA